MGRNKLFSLRLSDEIIQELQEKFPGLSTVEGIRACIEEVLGLSKFSPPPTSSIDIVGTVNEILQSVYERLDKLEDAVFQSEAEPPDDEVTTPPQKEADLGETIRGILRSHPEAASMAAKVAVLKSEGIKIPGKGGRLVHPTTFNLEPYL